MKYLYSMYKKNNTEILFLNIEKILKMHGGNDDEINYKIFLNEYKDSNEIKKEEIKSVLNNDKTVNMYYENETTIEQFKIFLSLYLVKKYDIDKDSFDIRFLKIKKIINEDNKTIMNPSNDYEIQNNDNIVFYIDAKNFEDKIMNAIKSGDLVLKSGKTLGKIISTKKDGSSYNGNHIDGIPHGYGELITNEYVYVGNFNNGLKEGQGTLQSNNNDFKYIGEFQNDIPNGKGVEITDSYKYEGDYKNGDYDGIGVFTRKDGFIHRGEFKNGFANGKGTKIRGTKIWEGNFTNYVLNGHGKFTDTSTNFVYEGEFLNNNRHGYGKSYLPDKFRYEGNYKNDVKDGYGIYESFNPDFRYEGNFKDGFSNGKGTKIRGTKIWEGNFTNYVLNGPGKFTDTSINFGYEGEFLNNNRHGYGKSYLPDEFRYEGNYKNNVKDGYGIYVNFNPDFRYEGNFKDDLRHGKGVETYDTITYDGEFLNDHRTGKAKLTDTSLGYQYEGSFIKGLRNGVGEESYSNGYSYKGEFKDNKKHGFGVLTKEDGTQFTGKFLNDLKDGKFIVKTPNNETKEVVYKNNIIVEEENDELDEMPIVSSLLDRENSSEVSIESFKSKYYKYKKKYLELKDKIGGNYNKVPEEKDSLEYKVGYYFYQLALTAGKGSSRSSVSNQEVFSSQAKQSAKKIVDNKIKLNFEQDIDVEKIVKDKRLTPVEKGQIFYKSLVDLQIDEADITMVDAHHKSLTIGSKKCMEGTKCERSGFFKRCGCYLESGKWERCYDHTCD